MAPWIPRALNVLGGIPICRPKDLNKEKKERRTMTPEQKKKSKEKVRKWLELTKDSINYTEWLYANGEIVVVHLEGERFKNEMGPMNTLFIEHAQQMEEKYSIKIPVIPIGIEYEAFNSLDSRVWFRAGKPLDLERKDLMNVVEEEIRRLSNI